MPARHDAIHECAKVYLKLDSAHAGGYPGNHFKNDDLRRALLDHVRRVLHVLTSPSAKSGWCQLITATDTLASSLFDSAQHPAGLQAFRQDWNRVKQAANCP